MAVEGLVEAFHSSACCFFLCLQGQCISHRNIPPKNQTAGYKQQTNYYKGRTVSKMQAHLVPPRCQPLKGKSPFCQGHRQLAFTIKKCLEQEFCLQIPV